MKLTSSQMKAVTAKNGNFLIHAGSGAGKTSSFIARIANLIKNEGVDPESILGLTYTNEAAQNMRDKLSTKIDERIVNKVKLSTFHSFAYGLMKSNYPHLYSNRTLMKPWWRVRALWDICKELNLSMNGGELGVFISYQKTNLVKEGMKIISYDFLAERHGYSDSESKLQNAFNQYTREVRESRLFEFDDMIVDLYYSLLNDEDFAHTVTKKYKYIMVDEFQDTNTANLEILKIISDNNLFVVGDFRQGIYGFINANINNILNFTDDFDNVSLVELNENFRSTNEIVSFANKIIESAPVEKYKQFGSQLPARNISGEKVNIVTYSDEYSEIQNIIDKIQSSDRPYNENAILFRTNAQLGLYESAFADKEIPVDVSSSRSFFDRKEIADILAYAKHTIEEYDDSSISRVVNSPNRYIKRDTTKKVIKYAYDNDISFEEACRTYTGEQSLNLRKVAAVFDSLRTSVEDLPAAKFIELVIKKTGYRKHIEKSAVNLQDQLMKLDALDKLTNMAKMKNYKNIRSFLGHISLIEQNNKKSNNGVKLMTVHASKGLEFPCVFIPSVTDNNFPHDMNNDAEEERRLFYVACTRAKDFMEVSSSVFSKSDEGESFMVSPFLTDLLGSDLMAARKDVMIRGSKASVVSF